MKKFDITVIGSGPGGYVAAIKAGRANKKVALIEKEEIGGTCLNIGCIPTKTLLNIAKRFKDICHSMDYGIEIPDEVILHWDIVQERKRNIIYTLRKGIEKLIENAKVEFIKGEASFIDKNHIEIKNSIGGKELIETEKTIIAIGLEPSYPNFIPRAKNILTSSQILELPNIPESIIIVGGGIIGSEFASLLSDMGSKVTIVEMCPNILPNIDKEIIRQITREFKKRRIKILTGNPIEHIESDGKIVKATVKGKEIEAQYMLVAIGRKPTTLDNLKINNAGKIEIDKNGFIVVNEKFETSIEGIYAIGDIIGKAQLAHFASKTGFIAAENVIGRSVIFHNRYVPQCIFTDPEIASVGLTEEECKEKQIDIKIGKFPFPALGKSLASGESVGFAKIISDSNSHLILGAHIIGAHATDLINEITLAMEKGITAKEIGDIIHPHPTFGEIIMETAHSIYGESVHIIKK